MKIRFNKYIQIDVYHPQITEEEIVDETEDSEG